MVAAKKPVKKAVAKKAAPKKTSVKAVAKKVSKPVAHNKPEWKTGKLGRETRPFFSFRITSQTVIWAIFMIVVLLLQLVIIFKELDIINTLG